MTTIKQLLKIKGNEVCSISSDAYIYEGLQIMAEKNVGALLVIDDSKLLGVFSERDYARKVILQDKYSKNTKVGELMTTDIVSVEPNMTIEECMTLMTTKRVRHLPVFENDQLVGVISIGDIVNAIITDQEKTIDNFEKKYLWNWSIENYFCGSCASKSLQILENKQTKERKV